ncbi:DKNYY domain-containing protein [Prevotella falsenii]|uniref:DKNYY domain-containing protein n=1 Tax=Prevotella falsenii TaxID=515414 RepID=UPI00046AD528|nr:DKNYY domain-containing protein [Prevotella falsenii]
MKQTNFKNLRHSALLLFAAFALIAGAQPQQQKQLYSFNRKGVYYERQPMVGADYRSFIDLGYGYAKDRYNVYYRGRVLPYVDPATFRLRLPGMPYPDDYPMDGDGYGQQNFEYYRITSNAVLFRGKKLDASPHSFKELGWGYGKDAFNVYYMGKKVEDAFVSNFRVLEDGYAEDTFNTYYRGRKIE